MKTLKSRAPHSFSDPAWFEDPRWNAVPSRVFRYQSAISRLPAELIGNILNLLDYQDLVQCALVSKLYHRLINESSRLMYTLELAKSRMISVVPPDEAPIFSNRLALLRERERAWRVLGWRKRRTIELPPTGSLYEFVGGVYANGRDGDNSLTTSISFAELPSLGSQSKVPDPSNHKQELKLWTHLLPDVCIIDFTMDPLQDLLVLVAVAPPESPYVYQLHVLSMKLNQPHPRAPSPILPCLLKPPNIANPIEIVSAVRVQVCGDLVALLIRDVTEIACGHLEIFNWKYGPKHTVQMPQTRSIDDFSFLTPSVALIVRPTGNFEVYDFVDPKEGFTSEPVLRYSLGLPPLAHGYAYWYISVSSNPTPGHVPFPGSTARTNDFLNGERQIYSPDPAERVHACCLYILNPPTSLTQAVSSFVVFIKTDTLLNPPAHWFTRAPSADSYSEDERPYCRPDYLQARLEAQAKPQTSTIDETRPHSRMAQKIAAKDGNKPKAIIDADLGDINLPLRSLTDVLSADQPSASGSVVIVNPENNPVPSSSLSTASTTTEAFLSPLQSDRYPAVPWKVWGTPNTRWFDECISTDWQHAIYGMRAVDRVDIASICAERNIEIHKWVPGRTLEDEQAFGDPPDGGPPRPIGERRFLRVRDFNPYSSSDVAMAEVEGHEIFTSKGRIRTIWRSPRLVSEPSRIQSSVFVGEVVSALAYTETVSDETYDVTDVMVDDCRVLLLKRGQDGKLIQLEVLML